MTDNQPGGFRMRPREPARPEAPRGSQVPVTCQGPSTPPGSPKQPRITEKPLNRAVDGRSIATIRSPILQDPQDRKERKNNSGKATHQTIPKGHPRREPKIIPTTRVNGNNVNQRPADPRLRDRSKDVTDLFSYSGLGKLSPEALMIMEWNTRFDKNSPDLREFFKRCLEYQIWRNSDKEGRVNRLNSIRERLRRNEEVVKDVERRPSEEWLATLLAIRAIQAESAWDKSSTAETSFVEERSSPLLPLFYNDRREMKQQEPNSIPLQESQQPAEGPSSPSHDRSLSDMELEQPEEEYNPACPLRSPMSPTSAEEERINDVPMTVGETLNKQDTKHASLYRHSSPVEAPSIPSDSSPAPSSSSTARSASLYREQSRSPRSRSCSLLIDEDDDHSTRSSADENQKYDGISQHRKRSLTPSDRSDQFSPLEEAATDKKRSKADAPVIQSPSSNESLRGMGEQDQRSSPLTSPTLLSSSDLELRKEELRRQLAKSRLQKLLEQQEKVADKENQRGEDDGSTKAAESAEKAPSSFVHPKPFDNPKPEIPPPKLLIKTASSTPRPTPAPLPCTVQQPLHWAHPLRDASKPVLPVLPSTTSPAVSLPWSHKPLQPESWPMGPARLAAFSGIRVPAEKPGEYAPCGFCESTAHYPECCDIYVTHDMRRRRRDELGLCVHCVKRPTEDCTLYAHVRPCGRCGKHNTHMAFCRAVCS